MRSCTEIVDLLSDYLDEGLPPGEQEAFDRHMAACPPCVEFLDSLRATQRATRGLRCDDIPKDVQKSLRAFLERAARRRRR